MQTPGVNVVEMSSGVTEDFGMIREIITGCEHAQSSFLVVKSAWYRFVSYPAHEGIIGQWNFRRIVEIS